MTVLTSITGVQTTYVLSQRMELSFTSPEGSLGQLGSTPRPFPFHFFQSTWPVPPAPATQRGQSIILFKDLENAAANVVISSVLQYGVTAAGSGRILTFVQPIPVNRSAVLTNVISLTANNNPNFNYQVGGSSGFTVFNIPQLTRATIGLEAHGVVAKSDYPATASTQITQINVQLSGPILSSKRRESVRSDFRWRRSPNICSLAAISSLCVAW
ncbi:hypothetical protein C8J57DRAFT_1713535 [Mycena rebaudengoi]|nr:hypothetical protein C8J57DRAFT_1713535 [Mycena rebaudengoi]